MSLKTRKKVKPDIIPNKGTMQLFPDPSGVWQSFNDKGEVTPLLKTQGQTGFTYPSTNAGVVIIQLEDVTPDGQLVQLGLNALKGDIQSDRPLALIRVDASEANGFAASISFEGTWPTGAPAVTTQSIFPSLSGQVSYFFLPFGSDPGYRLTGGASEVTVTATLLGFLP